MSQNTTVKPKLSDKWANFMGMFSGNSNPVDTSYAANAGGAGGNSPVFGNMSGKAPTYGEVLNGASGANPSGTTAGSGAGNSNAVSSGIGISGITEPLDTYEQYLQGAQNVYKDIYTENTNFYDQQNKETIAAIEEQKKSDITYANNQHQILADAINKARESGTKLAKEQYDLLMNMSEEQRQTLYKAAEAQREEEYRLADIERERGVVDARTSYAQNMATYGANAERMGRMGLTGSGYSDYVNAQAYATQRAETQAVNAQSEKAKREARYAENQARLDADLSYNENQYKAQSQYSKDMHDAETTYSQNMADANIQKNTMIHDAESTARKDTLTANQAAATGKHEAWTSYQENILGSEGELAKHRLEEEKEAEVKAEAKEQEARNAYLTILSSPGSYSAEDIDALATEYGFSPEQVNSLKSAVTNAEKEETEQETEALDATSSENYQSVAANIKMDPDYYTDAELDAMVGKLLTADDAKNAKQLKIDVKKQFAEENIKSYIASGDLGSLATYLEEAYNGGNGVIDLNTYQDAYFRAALQGCANTSGTSEILEDEAALKNLKDAGKISSTDYENAVEYLYSCAGSTIPNKAAYGHNVFGAEIKNGQLMEVTINGEKYDISTDINGTMGNFVDKDTAKVLAGICGNSYSNGSLAKIGDTIYVYREKMSNGSGWVKVKQHSKWTLANGTSKGFYDEFDREIRSQPSPSAPKHTPSSSN